MKTESESNNKSGMGCVGFFVGLLQAAFIVMKIAGVIEWSWLWVLAPVWIYAGICLLIITLALIIKFIIDSE